jgi:hypothetical protein
MTSLRRAIAPSGSQIGQRQSLIVATSSTVGSSSKIGSAIQTKLPIRFVTCVVRPTAKPRSHTMLKA